MNTFDAAPELAPPSRMRKGFRRSVFASRSPPKPAFVIAGAFFGARCLLHVSCFALDGFQISATFSR